jgi:hypothetical protein
MSDTSLRQLRQENYRQPIDNEFLLYGISHIGTQLGRYSVRAQPTSVNRDNRLLYGKHTLSFIMVAIVHLNC